MHADSSVFLISSGFPRPEPWCSTYCGFTSPQASHELTSLQKELAVESKLQIEQFFFSELFLKALLFANEQRAAVEMPGSKTVLKKPIVSRNIEKMHGFRKNTVISV